MIFNDHEHVALQMYENNGNAIQMGCGCMSIALASLLCGGSLVASYASVESFSHIIGLQFLAVELVRSIGIGGGAGLLAFGSILLRNFWSRRNSES